MVKESEGKEKKYWGWQEGRARISAVINLWLVFFKVTYEIQTDLWETEGKGFGKGLCI